MDGFINSMKGINTELVKLSINKELVNILDDMIKSLIKSNKLLIQKNMGTKQNSI